MRNIIYQKHQTQGDGKKYFSDFDQEMQINFDTELRNEI